MASVEDKKVVRTRKTERKPMGSEDKTRFEEQRTVCLEAFRRDSYPLPSWNNSLEQEKVAPYHRKKKMNWN